MDNQTYEFQVSHKIAELYSIFRELAEGLDEDHLELELLLHPCGSGRLLADEQRPWDSVECPPWLIAQRNQVTWYMNGSVLDNLELGLVLMRTLLNRKRAHTQSGGST